MQQRDAGNDGDVATQARHGNGGADRWCRHGRKTEGGRQSTRPPPAVSSSEVIQAYDRRRDRPPNTQNEAPTTSTTLPSSAQMAAAPTVMRRPPAAGRPSPRCAAPPQDDPARIATRPPARKLRIARSRWPHPIQAGCRRSSCRNAHGGRSRDRRFDGRRRQSCGQTHQDPCDSRRILNVNDSHCQLIYGNKLTVCLPAALSRFTQEGTDRAVVDRRRAARGNRSAPSPSPVRRAAGGSCVPRPVRRRTPGRAPQAGQA